MKTSASRQPNARGKAFSSIDLVGQCLLDRERSEAFDRAIRSVVRPHHVVLDAGTGSALLAMFAARAGAKRVIALEFDPYIAAAARANIDRNGLTQVIEVVEADARSHHFGEGVHFDVVIAEMLTTGCIDEYQVQALNNLHCQRVCSQQTIFLPFEHSTFARLGQMQYGLYNLHFAMVRHQWKWLGEVPFHPLSTSVSLNRLSFERTHHEDFSETVAFQILEDSNVDSLFLESSTALTLDISLRETLAMNGPVILPLNGRAVRANEWVCVKVSYQFGGGFESFKAVWVD